MSAHIIKQRQKLLALHLVGLKFTVFLYEFKFSLFILQIQILDLRLEILNSFF